MYDERLLVDGSAWRHVKTDGVYYVLGVACSAGGPGAGVGRLVVYRSGETGQLWFRGVPEFLDGRFVPLGQGEQ